MKECEVEKRLSRSRMEEEVRATVARLHKPPLGVEVSNAQRHQENLLCYILELTFMASR
jgi:hypothetical protein